MKTLIILTIIYLVSVVLTYNYMRIAHSEGGRWSSQNTGFAEIFFTVTPFLNTMFSLFWFCKPPYYNTNNFNNFFKVKK